MSRLVEEIEAHLERVRIIEGLGREDAKLEPDFRHHERTLVEAFERARQQSDDERVHRELERDYRERWSRFHIRHFVEELDWELLTDAEIDGGQRKRMIDGALLLAARLEYVDPAPFESVRRMWLAELSERVSRRVRARSTSYGWEIVSRYCARQGLVSPRAEGPRVRMPGLTWLRLVGADRLRWLLALEREHAIGDDDPWSLSTTQLARLRRHAGRSFGVGDIDEEDDVLLLERSSVDRWAALGALRTWEHEGGGAEYFGYELSSTGERWLSADRDQEGDPFASLARAQMQDDRAAVLTPTRARDEAELTATTMRYARLVAHEVRNKLVPINYAIGKVWDAAAGTELAARLAEPRAQIERDITSLYAAVETWARMSAPVAELDAEFFVLDAIDEARRSLEHHRGRIDVATIPGAANPRCRGHQGPFVLTLLNLMRNALQAGGPEVSISLTVDASAEEQVEILVDDDGPGVDSAMREQLFVNGSSTRADGTGHGLALAREQIERELGGTIDYEDNVDGGARFRLRLPSVKERP